MAYREEMPAAPLELNFDPFPVLTTPRLILRPITLDDTAAMYALRSDKEVMRYIARPLALVEADAARYIEKLQQHQAANEGVTWGIAHAANPRLIGTIGFWQISPEDRHAEIGYALAREHWGQGLMQEALPAVLAHGFDALKLHRVEAVVAPRNLPSIQLLLRNGFEQEGLFRQNCFFAGEFLDSAVFARLRSSS